VAVGGDHRPLLRILEARVASPLLVFKHLATVRRELASYVRWFNTERPHWSLKGLAAGRREANIPAYGLPGL